MGERSSATTRLASPALPAEAAARRLFFVDRGQRMTCYQRHLGWLFEAVDVPYEKGPRRDLHLAVIELLGLPEDAHCPEVWSALKETYGIDTHTESNELAADVAARLDAQG